MVPAPICDDDSRTHLVAVTDRRMSTAVPSIVAGENSMYELTNMDLAMKLHYLRGVYYFPAASSSGGGGVEELTVAAAKTPVFGALDNYYVASGRIRRSESGGRPAVKCNDSGVRIVEAKCGATLDEWLREASAELSRHRHLAPEEIVGPELLFSPLVYVQFTRFKCGGFAVGISWAHALSDAVSLVNFMHMWAQIINRNPPPKPHHLQNNNTSSPPQKQATKSPPPSKTEHPPLSTKKVDPVGDIWLPKNEANMESFSFHVTQNKLNHLQSKISPKNQKLQPFEVISALFWHCVAKIRKNREPKVVTVCKARSTATTLLSNQQMIGTVKADEALISPAQAELSELTTLLAEGFVEENRAIEEQIDEETGEPDLIVYGANLTFVDMGDLDLYGLELKGQKPVLVNFGIGGVGDEGAVLVFQGPRSTADAAGEEEGGGGGGQVVNVILPEKEVLLLRKVLQREWGIA